MVGTLSPMLQQSEPVDVKWRILDHPEPVEWTMTEIATLYSGPKVSIVEIRLFLVTVPE